MSVMTYHAPTGADPEVYHLVHDAISMMASAAELLRMAEQAADAEEMDGAARFNATASDALRQAIGHAASAVGIINEDK